MLVKSRCIVLHRFAYSDSSWIAKVLTEESGIVSFILKGAKRKESPFKGALDPLALSEIVFNQNPQKVGSAEGGLTFVKEASLIRWHNELRSNLLELAVAQVMTEIILKYAPQGVPLQDEFALLCQALDDLDRPDPSPFVFARWLQGVSDLWGYHLDLEVCSRCERALTEAAADFHPESGGQVCRACQGVESSRAKPETLKGLWMLRHGGNPGSGLASEFIPCRSFVENALLAYLRNHIGFLRELKSLQFLSEARKLYLEREEKRC